MISLSISIHKIEELVVRVYQYIEENALLAKDFNDILEGCKVFPPMLWLKEVYHAFSHVCEIENAVPDTLKTEMMQVMDWLIGNRLIQG